MNGDNDSEFIEAYDGLRSLLLDLKVHLAERACRAQKAWYEKYCVDDPIEDASEDLFLALSNHGVIDSIVQRADKMRDCYGKLMQECAAREAQAAE